MITIVNYDMGNLGSIQNMLNKIGVKSIVTSSPDVIKEAEKLLLPGVGNFNRAMENLRTYGLIDVLNKKVVVEKTPILGICLGMQLMTTYSEEGDCAGLGWIDAQTLRFPTYESTGLKVPHMGWNEVSFQNSHILSSGLVDPRFYFVHTYRVLCNSNENVLCKTTYGEIFHSGICKDNIIGVQFHPEKSHMFGFKLLENFSNLTI
jgi:glutamine amidotransferase